MVPSLTRITGIVPMLIMLVRIAHASFLTRSKTTLHIQQLGLGYEQPADSTNRPTPGPRPDPPRGPPPGRRLARQDSLSIDISTVQTSGAQSSPGPGEVVVVKEAQSWTEVEISTPWKTVGGGDMADLHDWFGGEIDLERGEKERRRSSEF